MYTASSFLMATPEQPTFQKPYIKPPYSAVELAIREDDLLGVYLKQSHTPRLSYEEEQSYGYAIRRGDSEARKSFASANTGLVFRWAKRRIGSGLEYLDLIGHGNEGLMKAVDKWDPDRGTRFSTYAKWWIQQKIGRAIFTEQSAIRIPEGTRIRLEKYWDFCEKFLTDQGRKPTPEEMQNGLGWSDKEMNYIKTSDARDVLHFDDETDYEVIRKTYRFDPQHWNVEHISDIRAVRTRVRQVLDGLPFRVYRGALLRFGLDGRDAMPWKDVGRVLRLSPDQVYNLKKQVYKALRASPELKSLTDDVIEYPDKKVPRTRRKYTLNGK